MARDSIRCSFCGKKQEQVGRIIAGPNVYICNECVELCSSILHDEMHNGLNEQQLELPDTLPTPQQIKTYMDHYIIGQDDAKRAVAVALRNRYRRAQLPEEIREEYTAYSIFFEKYRENKAAETTEKINNSYIEDHGQPAGTKSYGLVVDLTVAYYKAEAAK